MAVRFTIIILLHNFYIYALNLPFLLFYKHLLIFLNQHKSYQSIVYKYIIYTDVKDIKISIIFEIFIILKIEKKLKHKLNFIEITIIVFLSPCIKSIYLLYKLNGTYKSYLLFDQYLHTSTGVSISLLTDPFLHLLLASFSIF